MAGEDILAALQGVQSSPIENYYGMGSAVLGATSPKLINPYGSVGSNLAIALGSVLGQGLLTNFAQEEAAKRSLADAKLAISLQGLKPEERISSIETADIGGLRQQRLLSLANALKAREYNAQQEADAKRQEQFANLAGQEEFFGSPAGIAAQQRDIQNKIRLKQIESDIDLERQKDLKRFEQGFINPELGDGTDPLIGMGSFRPLLTLAQAREENLSEAQFVAANAAILRSQKLTANEAQEQAIKWLEKEKKVEKLAEEEKRRGEAPTPLADEFGNYIPYDEAVINLSNKISSETGATGNKALEMAEKVMKKTLPDQKKYEEKVMKAREVADTLDEVIAKASTAVQKAGVTGGPAGIKTARDLAAYTQSVFEDKNVSGSQTEKLAAQSSLDSVSSIVQGLGKTPGSVSDFEAQMLIKGGPSSQNTKAQNEALIQNMIVFRNLNADYAEMMDTFLKRGNTAGAEKLWRDYKKNEVFKGDRINYEAKPFKVWAASQGITSKPQTNEEKLAEIKRLKAEAEAIRAGVK